MLKLLAGQTCESRERLENHLEHKVDAYFSADVETDGPIPGPYSMLSFAIVYAGTFDGRRFKKPENFERLIYREMRPISESFEFEALRVNGLDRDRLKVDGMSPELAMLDAHEWVKEVAGSARPVLVAYPVSFDWTWLYWYFVRFCSKGSPFGYSQCYDIKTAFAVKAALPISSSGRSQVDDVLKGARLHSHHAIDDAIEQAEIFANIFEWRGRYGEDSRKEKN